MSRIHRLLIYFALICVIGLSCRKDGTGPSWDVDIVAPLLRTNLSLSNLIADSLLASAPDGALSIAFDGNVFRLSLDTLVNIPDETIQETFILPFGTIKLAPGGAIPTLGNAQEETKYDLNSVELKEVKIRSGSITFELSSSIQEVVELTYQMQNALKGGVPFSISELVPAGTQTSMATITRTYDLSGYSIDMRGVNLNDFNTVVAQFAAIISPAATDSVIISQGDQFDIKYTFNSIKTEFAAGYFGSSDVTDSFTDTINLFRNIPSGYLDLDSIGMIMKIENGFGIDAQLKIDTLQSINTISGASVNLNHSIIGNSINVSRALNFATLQTPFTYSEYSLTMNTSNSNVDALIETLPDQFKYTYTMKINPFGNNSNGNDFIYYTSDLKIGVDLKIPARFSADGLTIVDTVDFDLGKDPKSEHEKTIIGGFFYLFAKNGFPFDARLQVYLYDENFSLIDSLILSQANLISAAPIGIDNKVTAKLESRLDIPVDDNKVIGFEKAKKAIVKAVFTTKPSNQIVTIYDDYNIDLKLVGDFIYRVQIK